MFVMSRDERAIFELELLIDALEDIALQAHGHRYSTACNDGENIALTNIRNIALLTLEKISALQRNPLNLFDLREKIHDD